MTDGWLAGLPQGPLEIPPRVRAIADGDEIVPVWENPMGGLTFRLLGEVDRYVKWQPAGPNAALISLEAEKMQWAGRHTPAPKVIAFGRTADGAWLVTRTAPGLSAVSERWKAEPRAAARAIGAGLRAMHDAMPIRPCPYSWAPAHRIAAARAEGRDVPAAVRTAPPVDKLVVCHGDPCAPNTLIDEDGTWSAHVDFGNLGVADRWADLAVAALSTQWNFGDGFENDVYDAYGIERDPMREAYYRELWNAA